MLVLTGPVVTAVPLVWARSLEIVVQRPDIVEAQTPTVVRDAKAVMEIVPAW